MIVSSRHNNPRYAAGQKAVKRLAETGTPWKEEALIIGFTGAIASGKSTVADYLETKGAALVDGDVISRELVQPGKPVFNEIVKQFGPQMVGLDGQLDRKKLGQEVFGNEESLLKLNEITHPHIWEEMTRQTLAAALNTDVVLIVMPLLLEHGAEQLVDQVWVTDVSEETQLKRLMTRDKSSREQAIGRINAQMSAAEKRVLADVLIDNNGTLEETFANADNAWQEHVLTV